MHIPGYTYPVEEFYLEDVVEATGCSLAPPPPCKGKGGKGGRRKGGNGDRRPARRDSDEEGEEEGEEEDAAAVEAGLLAAGYSARTAAEVVGFDGVALPLLAMVALIKHIEAAGGPGAVLVFLTGWDEITKLHDLLEKQPESRAWALFPLHGAMPTAQQRGIFARPPAGKRKVVLATNIAESSITIDDVVFVLDGGNSRRRACHFTDIPSPSTLKRLLKGEGGAAE